MVDVSLNPTSCSDFSVVQKLKRLLGEKCSRVESSIKHFMTVGQDDMLQMDVHRVVEEVEKGDDCNL